MGKRQKCSDDGEERTPDGGFKIKTYYPNLEQMRDFPAYMKYIHEDGGHRAGLAKIVPPPDYNPRKKGYMDEDLYEMEITCPIRQEVTGEGGLYQQMNIVDKKKMTVRNFKRLSEDKHPTPVHQDQQHLDRLFWKSVFVNPSIYGADVSGSLFDENCNLFNLTKLGTILDNIQSDYNVTIQGVNTTYLYFGMWKSSFCWHTEDMDLYSINYLHLGEPKSWYCIAPEYGRRFERLAESFFPHSFKGCKAFLRHKTTMISPQVLKKYSIPFSRATQNAREFMVTFPYSYHSGYNNGFNIAEATNFATEHWIDYGKWATRCECSSESVKISMQTFVKRYQSDRYPNWIVGKDICKDPREPKHVAAAPKPTEHDLFIMGEHDEDRPRVALQQNHSGNLDSETKFVAESVKGLTRLLQTDQITNPNETEQPLLPHYSPMVETFTSITERVPIRFNKNNKAKPLDKPEYKSKSNKVVRSEQRALDRIVAAQKLLQFLPSTFTQEKKFNRCIAALPPHCAVCQFLVPHPRDDERIWGTKASTSEEKKPNLTMEDSQTTSDGDTPMDIDIVGPTPPGTQVILEEFTLPETSEVLLPRSAISDHAWPGFTNDSLGLPDDTEETNSEEQTNNQPKEADSGYGDRMEFLKLEVEPQELLQCFVCMLCVHYKCYGLRAMPNNKGDWICDRCKQSNRSIINCTLCPCRGGALKSVDNTWVHISCALTLPNVKLNDLTSEDIEIQKKFKLPDATNRRSCAYCIKSILKYVQGTTVSCAGGENGEACHTSFHPTCGHRNGVRFEIYDHHIDPKMTYPMIARCPTCLPAPTITERSIPSKLTGHVIALSKSGYYEDGTIHSHLKKSGYQVFCPQSCAIETVTDKSIIKLEKSYSVGERVNYKTNEGILTGKIMSRVVDDSEYLVRFEGSAQNEKVEHKNIWRVADEMSEEQAEVYASNFAKNDDV